MRFLSLQADPLKKKVTFFLFRCSTCDWPVILVGSYISMKRSMIFSPFVARCLALLFFVFDKRSVIVDVPNSSRCTLTMSLYTFLLLAPLLVPFILRCYKVPRTAATISNAPDYSRGRKRDIFYSRTLTWKGTFIFADRLSRRAPPRYFFPLQNSRGDINTRIRERGLRRRGSRRTYNMDIVLVPSKNFLSLRHRRPSNFSYSFPNRLAPDSASCRILESPCRCTFVRSFCIAREYLYMPVNRVYPRSSASREQHVSRSIFNSRIVHYFLQ